MYLGRTTLAPPRWPMGGGVVLAGRRLIGGAGAGGALRAARRQDWQGRRCGVLWWRSLWCAVLPFDLWVRQYCPMFVLVVLIS